ncbi:MAG: dipeptidase PepE [Bacteroidales bacterium]|nr:dipeptidase PepE [Bacteroidales bacterium]
MRKRLLLISNSTNYGEDYLEWPRDYIRDFLNKTGVRRVLFVPYAGVALSDEGLEESFNAYEERVNRVFNEMGFEIYSIHREKDPVRSVKDALAIAVGGGNTFHLVYMLHQLRLMKAIKEAVEEGLPYMGWSAGANIACPTMRTTNDMPIVEPENLGCLSLVPFQINPHYLDAPVEGHGGETREQRIEEFMVINNNVYVGGLREGTLLSVEDDKIELLGKRPFRVFRFGQSPREFNPGDNIDFLLGN